MSYTITIEFPDTGKKKTVTKKKISDIREWVLGYTGIHICIGVICRHLKANNNSISWHPTIAGNCKFHLEKKTELQDLIEQYKKTIPCQNQN